MVFRVTDVCFKVYKSAAVLFFSKCSIRKLAFDFGLYQEGLWKGKEKPFFNLGRRADFPLNFLWTTDQSSQSFPFSSSSLLPAAAACTAGAFPPTLLLLSAFNSAFPCLPLPLRPPNSESTALQYCTFVTPASKRSN